MNKASKYEEARDWLNFLIDHPDKAVSVDQYRAQIIAAKSAVASAHQEMLAARARAFSRG